MSDPAQKPPWLAGLLFTLAAAILLAWLQAPAAGLYGYDGPFHIRYAKELRGELAREGSFPHTFPAWQETFLRDAWADKDFLYHLLLIPFTGGNLAANGKLASILFGSLLYGSIFVALVALRAQTPLLWAAAALLGSTTLLYRSGLLRSHVVGIAVAVLGAAAILRERRIATALLAFLYALTHIGWHLLPAIALVHDAVRGATRHRWGRWRWEGTLAALGGTLAAVLVSPYFPANLRLWWVQNVGVLSRSWTEAGADLGLGLEMVAGRPGDLLYYNTGAAAVTALGIVGLLIAARRGLLEPVSLTLGIVSAGFLAMSFLTRRFVELWTPFSVMFAATALSPALGRWREASPRARGAAVAGLVVALASVGAHNVTQARRIIGEDPGPIFAGCAGWLRDHAEPGAIVVTTDWDEFPELYFDAPGLRYLVGLDPTFMQATSPRRFALWRELAEGRAAGLSESIAGTFHGRYLFADAGFTRLLERARQDPLLRPVHGEPDCSIFSIREGVAARGDPFEAVWTPAGGAAQVRSREADFVDVAALAPEGSDCLTLEGRVIPRSPRQGGIALALSTDDPIEVSSAGRTIFDSRLAPPPTLDDILGHHRAGGRFGLERRMEIGEATSPLALSVRSCRAGEVWGFHLRLPQGGEGP